MPSARRSRTIAAPAEQLWDLVSDPHHLPRWWPRVTRVEDVRDGAFTEVMLTRKGKTVRADFNVVHSDDDEHALRWAQRIQGTPFARLLSSAETEVRLTSGELRVPTKGMGSAASTEVTIELHQTLVGLFPRLGSVMVGRAAAATIEEALDGLERISV